MVDLAASGRVDARALDEVRVAQAHLGAGREPEVLGRRIAEIVLLDVKHARERHLARAGRRVLGVVDRVELLDLALGVVVDHHLEGPEHGHARGATIEVLAQGVLEERDVDETCRLVDADALAEVRIASGVYPRRRIPAMVGMRGSSQPLTCPSSTSSSSLRLLITV